MKKWRVVVVRSAQKEGLKFPKKDQKRIALAIASLEVDPFRGKKLRGELEGMWSLRVWPYRVVYVVEKEVVTVTVVRIGHRGNVYR